MANIIKGYKINIPKVTGNISIICRATSQQVSSNTYTITNKLTNCTNSNKLTSVDKDSPYTGTITENDGYELDSVNVTMNGVDITSSAVSDDTTPEVSEIYSITYNLSNSKSDNTASAVIYGNSYSTTIHHDIGYNIRSITVTMGGVNVTSSVVNNNKINISRATGNIVITVVADPKIALYKISNMTVYKGQTFNILYSSNISAVKHEFSWDGGKTFWDKTSEILVDHTVDYKYRHNAETNYNSFNMAIRVTDANGNTDVKYFTITFENNATENPPTESSDLLDSTGAYVIDDFSGTSVDRNKWGYELGYVRNGETQRYVSTNAEVNNGILALRGLKDSDGNWTSSSIISKHHFAFMYGKIVARVKPCNYNGAFGAFWTLGDSFEFAYNEWGGPSDLSEWWPYCGEFDIMEFYNHHLTCGTFFGNRQESGRVWYDNYATGDWHEFGMEWLENGTLIFTIDGHELSRTPATDDRAFHIPHYILLNQAVGASGGTPDDWCTEIPQYVDWVKYYPASTENVVLYTSDFSIAATDRNDNNCVVRATFHDNCINKVLSWSSSNTSIATVHSGLVAATSGSANGTANITATSPSGVSQTIQLNVVNGKIQ